MQCCSGDGIEICSRTRFADGVTVSHNLTGALPGHLEKTLISGSSVSIAQPGLYELSVSFVSPSKKTTGSLPLASSFPGGMWMFKSSGRPTQFRLTGSAAVDNVVFSGGMTTTSTTVSSTTKGTGLDVNGSWIALISDGLVYNVLSVSGSATFNPTT